MNLKGIKITKKMCQKINTFGVDNLKHSMLQGLDEFKKFTWSNFVKQEFKALINCMMKLLNEGIFSNINDNQLFIFNYYTDVVEMDIATVLLDNEENNVVIDIEYKSGNVEAAIEKLDVQIEKRVQDHMPQLFLNGKYIVIGMTENGFYKANYFDSKNNIEISDYTDLNNLMQNFSSNSSVEVILTQANNLAGIHNLYKEMEEGKFKYYEETKRTTDFILKKIGDGVKTIVCFSKPGTGKTVVAFKLFFENDNTMFLLMNQKFYNSLGLIKYFSSKRCFFGTDTFLSQNLSDKIVIVDEAQRLNKETILKIINSSKATILFGDVDQSFLPNDLDLDEQGLVNYLRENQIYVHTKELKRSKRYNDAAESALKFLSSRASDLKNNIILEDYKINIFYDVNEFLESYHGCKSSKKMFTTYDYRKQHILLIGDEIFYMAEKDDYSFAICTGMENYIGHTLHAISFDVENNYIFLKGTRIINHKKKDIIFRNDIEPTNELEVTKFLNELNILFTRGKKSLNIYTDDLEVYLYLNKKLKKILQK